LNNRIGLIRRALRHSKTAFFPAAALALAAVIALPAHAADDRAVKSRVSPIYPEIAKRMKIGGVVKIEASVDSEGKVTAVKTVSGNRVLAPAAEEAVSRWKFASAEAASTIDVDVKFSVAQ
jgi:TonB family protein